MLLKAKEEGYAVGAFNANNMEIIQAIVETAEEERAPVILQASQGAIKYAGLDFIVAMVRAAAESVKVPVALHLDHGTDVNQNVKCLRAGFTSLMFDGSKLPFEQNIEITRRVCDMAHPCSVPVEGEVGQIGKCDDSDEPGVSIEKAKQLMVKPSEAKRFVEETGVDSLAIAVGTIHGCKSAFAKIDLKLIKSISDMVPVPLVLHGGSGCDDEEIKKGIKAGISKINIDTRIRMAFSNAIRDFMKNNPGEIDPRKILERAKNAAKEVVRDRIRVFGTGARA